MKFNTFDLYFASYLVSKGHQMTARKDAESGRVSFLFDKTDILMEDRVKYYSHKATTDPLAYSDNIKALNL